MNKAETKEKKSGQKKDDERADTRNRKYLLIAAGAIVVVAIAVTAVFLSLSPVVATKGDTVSIYYTLTYENGTVISTNINKTPLAVTVGDPESIPGLSDAIMGMGLNQKKTVIIPFDQAYGPYRSDLIRVVNRTGPIANTTFTVGQYYTIHRRTDNITSIVRILNLTPSTVTWDENNPLASQNLTFSVQIVSLNKSAGEKGTGTVSTVIPSITVPVTMNNDTKYY